MQLFVSLTSPFARKVRIALFEKGLDRQVDQTVVDPWANDAALLAVNPLLQVPTLTLGDGLVLTNSDTILGWMERHYPQPALWPTDPLQRTRAEATAALTQSILEYTVFLVLEHRKPTQQQNPSMIQRRIAGIERTLQTLETRFELRSDTFHLDAIGTACALAYLDLRQPQLHWREHQPQMAEWFEWAAQRASMQNTAPPA